MQWHLLLQLVIYIFKGHRWKFLLFTFIYFSGIVWNSLYFVGLTVLSLNTEVLMIYKHAYVCIQFSAGRGRYGSLRVRCFPGSNINLLQSKSRVKLHPCLCNYSGIRQLQHGAIFVALYITEINRKHATENCRWRKRCYIVYDTSRI